VPNLRHRHRNTMTTIGEHVGRSHINNNDPELSTTKL
jgi:hypothetical protein